MLRPPRLLVPLTSLLSEEQRGLLLPSFPPFSHLKWKSDITTRSNGKTTVIGLSPISIDRFMGCDRGSITQLLYSLSTLHTGNCFPTCKTRFRLLTRLYRAGHFHPARFLLKVSAQGHSPLPDLSWRNMYNLSNLEVVRPLRQGVDRAGEPLPEQAKPTLKKMTDKMILLIEVYRVILINIVHNLADVHKRSLD